MSTYEDAWDAERSVNSLAPEWTTDLVVDIARVPDGSVIEVLYAEGFAPYGPVEDREALAWRTPGGTWTDERLDDVTAVAIRLTPAEIAVHLGNTDPTGPHHMQRGGAL